MTHTRFTCYICAETKFNDLGKSQDFAPGRILQCGKCNFISTYPMPKRETIRQFYTDIYSPSRQAGRGAGSISIEKMDKRAESQIKFIAHSGIFTKDISNLLEGKKVLDIGCGVGSLLVQFERLGADVYGYDLDHFVIEKAKERLSRSAELYVGEFDPVALPDKSMDLIVLSHVLEHIPNPIQYVGQLLKLLKPSGGLFIEVPNSTSSRVKTFVRHNFKGTGHLNYFMPVSLENLVNNAGGKIVQLNTFGPQVSKLRVPYGHPNTMHKQIMIYLDRLHQTITRMISQFQHQPSREFLSGEDDDKTRLYLRTMVIPSEC